MKKKNSTITKSYIILLGFSLILLSIFIFFLYEWNVSQHILKLKTEKKIILNLIKEELEEEFIDFIDDVDFLSATPQLKSLLYRKSNLKENQEYLKRYLEIKDKYIAGNIRNSRNQIIIEEYNDNNYIKNLENFSTEPSKKMTFTKIGKFKDNSIFSITTPILEKNGKFLGSISLYGNQNYIKQNLKKYKSTNLISEYEFYWFSMGSNKQINEISREEILKNFDLSLVNQNKGSAVSKSIFLTFDTIDLKNLLPQLNFGKDTSSVWKLIIKIPEKDIINIRKKNLNRYILLGIFIFFFSSVFIWITLKETNKRKFYENKLESQNQKLIENNRTKDKFISILAHDLKSPFTGITGIFNILIRKYDSYDESKKKKLIYSLNDSIQGINALLINLLEWSKIQRGHIVYSPIKVKINDLTCLAYQVLKLNLESKNIKFSNNISDKHFIWADKNMVEAVFRNIISNAIKFTPNFGKIELYSERIDKFILIYIKDNGVGMNLDIQSKLFKLDQHLTTLGTENEKGTGLGLIITKEFIHLNRGSLGVDSIKDQGTTFIIKLPAYREI